MKEKLEAYQNLEKQAGKKLKEVGSTGTSVNWFLRKGFEHVDVNSEPLPLDINGTTYNIEIHVVLSGGASEIYHEDLWASGPCLARCIATVELARLVEYFVKRNGDAHCNCWKTGKYIWTSNCPVHPIKDPWAYSPDELRRIGEDAKQGVFPEKQRRGD